MSGISLQDTEVDAAGEASAPAALTRSGAPVQSATAALDAPLDAASGVSLDDVAAAATVEADATPDRQFGRPGREIDRQAPFTIGFSATFGVAAAFVLLWTVYSARGLLTEIGLALFIALGLDPLVSGLERRRLPRWAAVVVVVLAALAVLAGIAGEVVPVVATQVTDLVDHLPHYERELSSHSSLVGRLNTHYDVINRVQRYITSNQSSFAGGIIASAGPS